MKHSIKRQMTIVFSGLIIFILVMTVAVYSKFLQEYYLLHKQQDLMEVHDTVGFAMEKGRLTEDDRVWKEMERTNISMLVLDREQVIFAPRGDKEQLISQLRGYLFNQNQEYGEILEKGDRYEIRKTRDMAVGMDYLEMWGTYPNGSTFLLRSPLDSIWESSALANKLLIYIGIAALVLGGMLVSLFARKITEPITELSTLSRRMSELDFDARYTRGGEDEIGILGNNFNLMSERLEKTISELKQANNELLKDIEQKEKMEDMRNEFLGNVSHELKTPLALIQGYAEGLKEGISDDPESREFYCDVIMDEASKMNRMVKNLLTLNQLEFGNEKVEFERFDVSGLVQGVIQSCEILIQQANAKVEFIGESPVYAWADEFKTEQVIRNYLTNAIHHVDHERRIEVKVISRGDKVRVSVFNSGKPIPQEDLDKLWDKFYKVDKAHTREYGGNGIGLSIVKAIMESFHQKYGVRNFDNGVEFWFELDGKCALQEEKNAVK
ncbi:MAG: HAMP domain-containing sensor histidine kinase [[Ruminococcus] gnavus]|nr:HAMP domain-containing sensor histidine kinase [Mediterraneibacter gnavus]